MIVCELFTRLFTGRPKAMNGLRRVITKPILVLLVLLFIASGSLSCAINYPESEKPASDELIVFNTSSSGDFNEICLMNEATGVFSTIATSERRKSVFENPTWAPDRRTIAYLKDNVEFMEGALTSISVELWTMDVQGKNNRRLTRCNRSSRLVWNPDNKAIICGDSIFRLTKKEKLVIDTDPYEVVPDSIAMNPNGHKVAYDLHYYNEKRQYGTIICDLEGKVVDNPRLVYSSPEQFNPTGYDGHLEYLPRLAWIDEQRLISVENTFQPVTLVNPSGAKLIEKIPYTAQVWILDVTTGAREMIYETQPWENIGNVTLSPSKKLMAFLYWASSQDPIEGGSRESTTKPAVLDLVSGEVKRIQVSGPHPEIENINWSSP